MTLLSFAIKKLSRRPKRSVPLGDTASCAPQSLFVGETPKRNAFQLQATLGSSRTSLAAVVLHCGDEGSGLEKRYIAQVGRLPGSDGCSFFFSCCALWIVGTVPRAGKVMIHALTPWCCTYKKYSKASEASQPPPTAHNLSKAIDQNRTHDQHPRTARKPRATIQ